MQVANTILNQLGGNKFIAMTGAKDLMSLNGKGLQFKLPARFAKNGINCVRVTLNAADLYDVEYGKVRGLDYKVLNTSSDIYADALRANFSEVTGLYTSI